jgi:iron complex outermembrane receptor protein
VRRVALACIIFFAVCSSQAEELETIVVTGTRAGTLPGSVTLLGESDVKTVGATHPSEIMQRVPGVWVSRGGGQEHLTALRSPVWTGAGACGEVVFAEDGVPVRPAGFCNANQLMEINTEQSGGVEILRGPQGGALYGANAIHGVVNVLSLPMRERRSVRAEVGRDDYSRLQWEQGDQDGYVAVNAAHDGGYQDSSGYDQQKLSWKQQQQFGGISLTHYLTATHLEQQSISYLVGDETYRDDSRQRDNAKPDAYRDADAIRYVQSWDWMQGDYLLSVKPYLRQTEMEFMQHFNFREPLEQNGHDSAGVQATASHVKLDWGTWQSGAMLEWADVWTEEWQTLPTVGTAVTGTHYDYDVEINTAAFWQDVSWNALDNLELQAGVRMDRTLYNYDNHVAAGKYGRFMRPQDRTDSYTLLSPRAGIAFTDQRQDVWYANISKGRRAPQTAELYRLLGNQQVADIDEESAQGGEIGWRGSAREKSDWTTQWNVALYNQHKKGVIVRNSSSVYDNSARTTHEGIEVGLHQSFPHDLYWQVATTYAEHRYDSDAFERAENIDGNIIDTAPRAFGSMQWGWQPGKSQLEFEWVHMSDYSLNPEGSFRYDGHDLLNVRASHVVAPGWTVFTRLMNVTDRDYAERADVTATGTIEPRYFVGLPRALFMGIEWQY